MKVSCTTCGALILALTAEMTGGVCMPCRNGTRTKMDAPRILHEELLENFPFSACFDELSRRAGHDPLGLASLSLPEQAYLAVTSLLAASDHRIDNFFYSNIAGIYASALRGLQLLGFEQLVPVVIEAAQINEAYRDAPREIDEDGNARKLLDKRQGTAWEDQLRAIEATFHANTANLVKALRVYALQHRLVKSETGR